MTVVMEQLDLAGGVGSDAEVTVWDDFDQYWYTEHYPKFPAGSCSVSAAISYDHYLLVASEKGNKYILSIYITDHKFFTK